jgi:transposase-like protein
MSEAINLIEFQERFATEQDCINYLAKARWGEEPICPHCGTFGAYKFSNGRLFKCKSCRKQFTVKVGTIFEDSALPLKKWFLAIYLITSLKKGLSSIQLSKYLGVTQKTAWFMLQRIRYAVNTDEFKAPLKNTIEGDETYYGPKKIGGKRGRGSDDKSPIFGLVERNGKVLCKAVENVKRETIMPLIQNHVEAGSTMMTDEFPIYRTLNENGFKHETVNHRRKEYVRGDAHTNTIEGYWSHLKAGLGAIYIKVSKKHLQKYCDEYSFRYNARHMKDYDRFGSWFEICGKRLTYNTLIAK